MEVHNKDYAVVLELLCNCLEIINFKIAMKVLIPFYEVDVWIAFIHEFQMENSIAKSNTGIKVLVTKGEFAP